MIGKILYKIGNALFGVFSKIHDALVSPDQPPVLSGEQMEFAASGTGPSEPVQVGSFKDTVAYYVGGTFVVTAALFFILARIIPGMKGKKRGSTARRRTTRKAAPRRRTSTRRRRK